MQADADASYCKVQSATVFLFSAMNDFWVPVQQKTDGVPSVHKAFMLAAASSRKTFRPGWRLADYLLLDWIAFHACKNRTWDDRNSSFSQVLCLQLCCQLPNAANTNISI
jgi:hypothetical protein